VGAAETRGDIMPLGPVDFLLARFEHGQFHGQMAEALADLVDKGIIHIIDLVFLRKEDDGTITTFEIDDLGELGSAYDDLDGEAGGLLSEEDLLAAAEDLEPGTAAGLLVWENVWAQGFVEALRSAGGEVIAYDRIPAADIEDAFAGLDDDDEALADELAVEDVAAEEDTRSGSV
jgi:hypothetical protein